MIQQWLFGKAAPPPEPTVELDKELLTLIKNEWPQFKPEIQRRAHRRRATVRIYPNFKLVVVVNKSMSAKNILDFLSKSRAWIEKQQQKILLQHKAHPRKEFVDGETFPVLGSSLRLVFKQAERKHMHVRFASEMELWVPQGKWNESFRQQPQPEVKKTILRAYEGLGRKILSERVAWWSEKMGTNPERLIFRCQKSRWGSCSHNGTISLNWKLIAAPLPVLDYVVVHELSHLSHLNHSPAFWRLVAQFVPDYKLSQKWLKRNAFQMDFLSTQSELHE